MNGSYRHRRAAFAAVLAVLWLLGIEVLPNAHLALHEDDHTHAASGTIEPIVRVTFASTTHSHADGVVHSHADESTSSERAPRRDVLAFDNVLVGHAAAGLAHHALALLQPPPPAVDALEVPRHAWWVERAPIACRHALSYARPVARGPPTIDTGSRPA